MPGGGVTVICRSDGVEQPASQTDTLRNTSGIFFDGKDENARKTRLFFCCEKTPQLPVFLTN